MTEVILSHRLIRYTRRADAIQQVCPDCGAAQGQECIWTKPRMTKDGLVPMHEARHALAIEKGAPVRHATARKVIDKTEEPRSVSEAIAC